MNLRLGGILVGIMTITGTNAQQCEKNSCQALVPYEANVSPLSRFKEQLKIVKLGPYSIELHQDWTNNGVAGVLWDSAIVLSKYLLSQNILKGKKVLELGAGIGLPSIIAVKEGAEKVVCTDVATAIPLLEKNIYQNVPKDSAISLMPLNWKEDDHNDDYDLILGADLVYIAEVFDALKSTLIRLTRKTTTVYMASKIRYAKDRRFYNGLKDSLRIEKVFYDRETDVHVYKILAHVNP